MKVKFLIDEDIVNYKDISMFVGFPNCSLKCNIDSGKCICQNKDLLERDCIEISIDDICKRYVDNDLTKSIVIGGMEPFDSPFELTQLVDTLRNKFSCQDPIIIYSGYSKEEFSGLSKGPYDDINYDRLQVAFKQIICYGNIIIKYGRYIPDRPKKFDNVLGIELASDNQFAEYFK